MTLPTFLVIGAAKSGTTSLAAYLGQHPDIFMPTPKEPNYFALSGTSLPPNGPAPPYVLMKTLYNWSRTEWEGYCELFAPVDGEHAVGEASVRYLYFEDAPRRIFETLPNVRLVAILRDPVSRLYSHYTMNRQMLLEPLALGDAMRAEPERIAAGWGWDWHYIGLGLYARQLRRYFELFAAERIAVFLYDDFLRDPLSVYQGICRHVGVEDRFVPDMSVRGMVSSRPRSEWLARWLVWPNKLRSRLLRYAQPVAGPIIRGLTALNAAPISPLDETTRAELAQHFHDDAAELAEMLGRDVSWRREAAE